MEMMECSHCGKLVEANVIWCRYCLRVVVEKFKSDCLFCGEAILKTDWQCRFCKAVLRELPAKVSLTIPYRPGGNVDFYDEDDDGFCGAPVRVPRPDPAPGMAGLAKPDY